MTPYIVSLPQITHLLKAYAGMHKLWSDNYSPAKLFCYSLGRWALASGVCALTPINSPMQVWLPEYICSEVPTALIEAGVQVSYYPVTKLMQPEWDWFLKSDSNVGKGQVLVIVHYFGFRQDLTEARSFCDRFELSLLEDAAHCLPFLEDMREGIGDAVVFSPRKIYPIPGLGVLLLRSEYGPGDPLVRIGPAQKINASVSFFRGVLKRWVLSLNPNLLMFKRLKNNGMHRAEFMGPQLPQKAAPLTIRLFSYYHKHRKQISNMRRYNYSLWHDAVVSLRNAGPLFPGLLEDDVPQIFPLIVQGERDAILSRLKSGGIPAGTWPDLPDEIKRMERSNAKWLQEHLITLPVHQDLKEQDMRWMTKMLREVLVSMGKSTHGA